MTEIIKLLIALQADKTILLQISEGNQALAHIRLNSKQAMDIAKQLTELAGLIK
jgi:hypothetical protein